MKLSLRYYCTFEYLSIIIYISLIDMQCIDMFIANKFR